MELIADTSAPGDYEVRVSWRDTTNYAAALGDDNPRYLDDRTPGGLVAPPMFAVVVCWQAALNRWNLAPRFGVPQDAFANTVHLSDQFKFHRLIRPGDELRVSGSVLGLVRHRSGTVLVSRNEVRDSAGELVLEELSAGLIRDWFSPGPFIDDPRHFPSEDRAGPAPLWSAQQDIAPSLPFVYDACAEIINPVHTSWRIAESVGLPGPILQGTATLALAAKEIIDRELDGRPEGLTAIGCRFTGMVLPPCRIAVELTGRHGDERRFRVTGEPRPPISSGYVRLAA